MSGTLITPLPGRCLITVDGPEAEVFLQRLVSNDVTRVTENQAGYAALLTPQGKFLFDFFMLRSGEMFFLDCEAGRQGELIARLERYRLRAAVRVADVSAGYIVAVLFGKDALKAADLGPDPGVARRWGKGWIYVDPRMPAAGARIIAEPQDIDSFGTVLAASPGDPDGYDDWRLTLGLPDGCRDMIPDKAFLLESGFDELNGIDWNKGCYIGQETTARTRHRSTLRKRLLPVRFDAETLEFDQPIVAGDQEIGAMRSTRNGRGLALLRLDLWRTARERGLTPQIDGQAITIDWPDWIESQPDLSEGGTDGKS